MAAVGRRLPTSAAVAGFLLLVDLVARLAAGDPYPGATALLVAACGSVLLPLLPRPACRPSVRIALVPVLGVASYAIFLTTASLVGVRLGELSIRVCVWVLVVALAAASAVVPRVRAAAFSVRREALAVAALGAVVLFTLAAARDVLDPYPPPGADWAYYLLYADEVEAQGHLLIDNPYAVGEVRSLGNYPGIGGLYGSLRILDGIPTEDLVYGLGVALALSALALYAAVAALWGAGGGLVAASVYAGASVHLEPLYWHGLATTLALAYVALALLPLGLLWRGERGRRVVLLLGLALASVAVMHSVTAGVVALLLVLLVAADGLSAALRRVGAREWWGTGVTRPVLMGIGAAFVLGAGVVAHLRLHSAEAGSPVSYRYFDREWLDAETLRYYFSWVFLAIVAASVVVLLVTPRLRRDRALVPVAALALAGVLVGQAWIVHVPFEYRRSVYYVGLALAAVVGVASLRLERAALKAAVYGVAVLWLAQVSIGLRLPARVFEDEAAPAGPLRALEAFRPRLEPGAVVVTDRCLGVRVPYALRTPTHIAAEEWQVGFTEGIADARRASEVLQGGARGRRLARELGIRYAVVDAGCTPDVAARLGGATVLERDGVVIVRLT